MTPRLLSSTLRKRLESQTLAFAKALQTPQGASQLAYLETRGLTEEAIARFHLGAVVSQEDCDDEELLAQAWGRVSIPFITPTGPVLLRYRELPPESGGPKYWQPPGSQLGLFNTPAIAQGGDRIVICEGEVDAITLCQVGLPAVGIPGASNWSRNPHFPAVFDGYDEIIFIQEDDEKEFNEDGTPRQSAAERLAMNVKEDLRNVRNVKLPRGFDSNAYYIAYGKEALLDIIKFPTGGHL